MQEPEFNIAEYPNSHAFVITLCEGKESRNVATFNYGYGISKDYIKFEAEQFLAKMELQLSNNPKES